jgi:hypothetical protein
MAAGRKTGGRQAGTPNKLGGTAKENIANVFTRLGGVQGMVEWAEENRTQFYQLYGKLLPLQVAGDEQNPLTVVQKVILEPLSDDRQDSAPT